MPDITKVGQHLHMPKRELARYPGPYPAYLTGAGHSKRDKPKSALQGLGLLPQETVFLVIPPGQRPIRVTPA